MVKPNYQILVDGSVVDFANRLLSLTLNDNEGYKNDTLTVVLDDRGNTIDLPQTAELEVRMGYGDGDNLFSKGSFEVDAIKVSGNPDTITITAKGSKINSSLKIRRTETYKHTTVGQLLETIAQRGGMDVKVSEFLRGIEITHLNQMNESDQNLLSKLKRNYDAEFKTISSNLLFYLKDDFKATSGSVLKPVVVNKTDCSSFEFEQTDRSKYEAVSAKWRDVDASEVKEVLVGSGDPVFTIKELFANQQEAKGRARTKYNDLLRGRITGNLTCVGNALIAGEFEIILNGFRPQLQTNFKCVSAIHRIDNNGYSTSFKVVNKK